MLLESLEISLTASVPNSVMSGMLFLLFTTSLFLISPFSVKVCTCVYELLVVKIRECGMLANPFVHYSSVFVLLLLFVCFVSWSSFVLLFSVSYFWLFSPHFLPSMAMSRICFAMHANQALQALPPLLGKKSALKKIRERERNIQYLKAAHIKPCRYYAPRCNIYLMRSLAWDWIRAAHFESHYSLALKQPFQMNTEEKHSLHFPLTLSLSNISLHCTGGLQDAINPQCLNISV